MAKYPKAFLELCRSVTAKRPRTVIDHILQHGHISTEELKEKYGYNHPPRAARDVREHGIPLETFTVVGADGRKIAAYRFSDPEKTKFRRFDGRTVFQKKSGKPSSRNTVIVVSSILKKSQNANFRSITGSLLRSREIRQTQILMIICCCAALQTGPNPGLVNTVIIGSTSRQKRCVFPVTGHIPKPTPMLPCSKCGALILCGKAKKQRSTRN
jgi:hypothetical protein